MTSKDYFSTGEAAQLLQISRCTVTRKFDQGALQGRRNPVTGERFINRESLLAFMSRYGLSAEGLMVEKKRVILATADEMLRSMIREAVSGDERIELAQVPTGSEVLLHMPKGPVDLLILDEAIEGLSCEEVVKFLRGSGECGKTRILCYSRKRGIHSCLECEADVSFLENWNDPAGLSSALHSLLGLPQEPPETNETHEHRRQWPRVPVRLPAKIKLYRLKTPYVRDPGEAVMENVSCGGAYLSSITLEKKIIPCEPFRILLEVDAGPLKKWRAHGRLVRLECNGSVVAGIAFTRISKNALRMIQGLSSATEGAGEPAYPAATMG